MGVFAGSDEITGGVRGNYGVVQRNGNWYGYFAGITTVSDGLGMEKRLPTDSLNPDLYEVDLQTHKFRKIARKASDEHDWRYWLIDDKGAVGAVLNVTSGSGAWTITDGHYKKLASGIDRGAISA